MEEVLREITRAGLNPRARIIHLCWEARRGRPWALANLLEAKYPNHALKRRLAAVLREKAS